MLRAASLILLLATGCSSDPTDATEDTDTVVDDGTHPLVPEEFELLWNTSGECSNEFGDGDQIYVIGEATVDEAGHLTATERVWWFYADQPNEADCVDTFSIEGDALQGDPSQLGYAGGEEIYDVRREFVETNCGERYGRIYRSDDDGLYQRLMFDTLNEFNDEPNEDDKLGVFHEERDYFGEGYVTKIYANEPGSVVIPKTETHGAPADYRWIGKRCQVAFGGGGGGG